MTESQPAVPQDTEPQATTVPQDGARIRQLRKERTGLYIADFADRLGIYPQTLTNIELNKKPISLNLLIKVARLLREPVDGLLRHDPLPDDDEEAETAALALAG
jgi:transcriptional regulator with XRE-family HTH domain